MRISHHATSLTVGAVGLLFVMSGCSSPHGLPPSTAFSQSSATLHPDTKLSGEVFASDGLKQRCRVTDDGQGGSKTNGVFGAVGYASGPVAGNFTVTGSIQSQELPSPSTTFKEQFTIIVNGREMNGHIKYILDESGGGALTCTKHRMTFDFSSVTYKLKGGAQGTTSVVLHQKSLDQSFL